ncbi:MAG: hypothetical protein ACO3TX_11890 [Pseudomonadales bacterium]
MIQGYESIAFNTAPDSENQIHSDDMAQRFGFQGGLVPGVTVSAYLIQPAVEAWGDAFYHQGSAHVQIRKPTYHDEPFRVAVTASSDSQFESQLLNPKGTINGVATVTLEAKETSLGLPVFRDDPLMPEGYRGAPASEARFQHLKDEGCLAQEFHFDASNPRTWYFKSADMMPELHQVTDKGARAFAHASFILGCGNWIFANNAFMNPWVHMETRHQHFAPILDGDTVRVEMRVVDWFERKGHAFADVDVSLFDAKTHAPRVSIHQRAIYRLRGS